MPNMSRSDANTDTIITEWIIEYARSLMWQQFKTRNSDPTSSDEFIRGVITKAQSIGYSSGEILLTEWLFLIHYGCNLFGNGLGITPLEKAISMLPHLKENFKSLKKKELAKVELLLKEQAVLVCIRGREFSLATKVKDRIWSDTTQAEQEMSKRLGLMIQSRSLSGFDASSSFEDLMESVRKLLEELCDTQLPCPYLLKRATEEVNKKVCDGEDQMARNLAAATQTGIMLTGPLLSAFMSKYKLQPDVGLGFVSQDAFESAVESLRSHKDQILKSVPCFAVEAVNVSSTPVVVQAVNVSPASISIDKTVSSSSLKRKSKERRSSNGHVYTRSSVSAKKDSHSSDDNSDDHDELCEKTNDISLRTRIAKSHKGPLFQEVEWRGPSPKKISNQRVKRKPRSKWTQDEEKTVYKAVKKYGASSWAEIVKANVLPGRSNVDIKDKWRTMLKCDRVKELRDELKGRLDTVDSSSEEN